MAQTLNIKLPHNFIPRVYQLPLFRALESGKKRMVCLWHRRSGKDITSLNLTIQQMVHNVGVYFYIFPTYNQARKVIWDSLTHEGRRLLDYFPKELIENINHSEMKIRLLNGSLFQLVGSDNYDALMGTNPKGVVFSEYALQNPKAYEYIKPILTANKGWAIFISTPRGKNHFYELWTMALKNRDWFCEKVTIDDSKFISKEDIEKDIQEGMSEETANQEYFCSFSKGVEGTYYGKLVNKCYFSGRISKVPYDPACCVDTFWDLGFGDSTAIIFVQQVGKEIHIIDCYENSGEGLSHYAKILQEKKYIYGSHFGPHDIEAGSLYWGKSLKSYAKDLGINFITIPRQSIEYGIECARSIFSYCWFDEDRCARLIKCLENYHKNYNDKMGCYSNTPCHDWSSHFADSFRYMATAKRGRLQQQTKLTPEKIRDMRQKHMAIKPIAA